MYKQQRVLSTEVQEQNQQDDVQPQTEQVQQQIQEVEKKKEDVEQKNEEIQKKREPPKLCSNPLIQQIGLKGLSEPQNNEMTMCWDIDYSCCSAEDQNIVVNKWKEESKYMLERFEYYEKIYFDILETYISISDRAMIVMKIIMQDEEQKNKETECKILSRRILHLKIQEIQDNIKEQIQNMHKFFELSYKGFYCSLCDPATSLMYLNKEQQIILSEKYCRDIIANSLNPLLYLNIHLPQLSELMTTFITRCSNEGVYDNKKKIEKQFEIQPKQKHVELLEGCRDKHDTKNWFSVCQDICRKFEITEYSKFFSPYLKFFEKYNIFLKEQIEFFDNPPKPQLPIQVNKEQNEQSQNNQEANQEKKNRRLKKIFRKNRWRILEEQKQIDDGQQQQNDQTQQDQEQNQDQNNDQPKEKVLTKEEEEALKLLKLKTDRKILDLGSDDVYFMSIYDMYGIDLYDYGAETEMVLKDLPEQEQEQVDVKPGEAQEVQEQKPVVEDEWAPKYEEQQIPVQKEKPQQQEEEIQEEEIQAEETQQIKTFTPTSAKVILFLYFHAQ